MTWIGWLGAAVLLSAAIPIVWRWSNDWRRQPGRMALRLLLVLISVLVLIRLARSLRFAVLLLMAAIILLTLRFSSRHKNH